MCGSVKDSAGEDLTNDSPDTNQSETVTTATGNCSELFDYLLKGTFHPPKKISHYLLTFMLIDPQNISGASHQNSVVVVVVCYYISLVANVTVSHSLDLDDAGCMEPV